MSTQYTPKIGLPYPQLDDTSWHVPLQAATIAVDGLAAVGPLGVAPTNPGATARLPSTTLLFNVAGGTFLNASGALQTYAGASSQSLAASSTTAVWLTDAGVLTTGASYPTGTQIVQLATITTGTAGITAISDDRIVWRSFGGSASGYVLKAGDTLGDGSNYVLGTTTGTRIGTASTQKLGFLGATPIVQEAATTDLRQVLIDFGFLASGGASPLNLNGGVLTGAVQLPVATLTSSVTISTLGLFLVNPGGNITITLPAASSVTGGVIVFKRVDATANTVTISRAGSDTIDGATTNTSLSSQWAVLRLCSTGSAWAVI